MSRRRILVLTILFLVGAISFYIQISSDDSVSLRSVLISLGTEGLKTAVLVFLIDYLISGHEAKILEVVEAKNKIDVLVDDKQSQLEKLLRAVANESGTVQLDVTSGANYANSQIMGIDWENSSWNGAEFTESDFKSCRLAKITMSEVDFAGTVFEGCVFKNVDFGNVDLSDTLFAKCEFLKCKMGQAHYQNTRFSRCEFWVMDKDEIPSTGAILTSCYGANT